MFDFGIHGLEVPAAHEWFFTIWFVGGLVAKWFPNGKLEFVGTWHGHEANANVPMSLERMPVMGNA